MTSFINLLKSNEAKMNFLMLCRRAHQAGNQNFILKQSPESQISAV